MAIFELVLLCLVMPQEARADIAREVIAPKRAELPCFETTLAETSSGLVLAAASGYRWANSSRQASGQRRRRAHELVGGRGAELERALTGGIAFTE